MPFTLDTIELGKFYECQVGSRIAPIYIVDRLPSGLVCKNMDTKREVFIKDKDVPRRIKSHIPNMSEWRLHNGD